MKRINLEKSKVLTQKNADDWCDAHLDENGFLKVTEGYFSGSADFKVYDFAELHSVKSLYERPFYGIVRGKETGFCYTYFIPASDVVFEDE